MQVYLVALETAFERDRGVSVEVRALAKRVAGFHSGFVANAATSAAKIIQGGIAYAFQVCISTLHLGGFVFVHRKIETTTFARDVDICGRFFCPIPLVLSPNDLEVFQVSHPQGQAC